MFTNDENTHELNVNDYVAVLHNISSCNASSNAVITKKHLDEIVNKRFQKALAVFHTVASSSKHGRSNRNKNNNGGGNKKKRKKPQEEK